MAYPTTLEILPTNRSANTPTVGNHADDHNDVNRLVNELQSKVGIDGSADTDSLDKKVSDLQADFDTSSGHSHDGTDSKRVLLSDIDTSGFQQNELIRASGDGSELESSGVIPSTDGTLNDNSDSLLPTQKAVKTYADALPGRLIGVTILTATSSSTFTTNAKTSKLVIEMVGAGGGGGGVGASTSGNRSLGAGGGGGGYVFKVVNVAPSTGYTYQCGAGGTAGASGGGNGGDGGSTTITIGATTYTASGGLGGGHVTNGSTVDLSSGGNGGTGTNGDINASGIRGFSVVRLSGGVGSSGAGGDSRFGGGGRYHTATAAGIDGDGYGGGGGGAASNNGGGARAGGAGSQGCIVVYEYM